MKVETKEEMLAMLEHIQHYCHEKWNCDRCIFAYYDGDIIKKCVFCGVLTIDCFPPDDWDLKKLREKFIGGVNNGN